MNFDLSEELAAVRELAREFAERDALWARERRTDNTMRFVQVVQAVQVV